MRGEEDEVEERGAVAENRKTRDYADRSGDHEARRHG